MSLVFRHIVREGRCRGQRERRARFHAAFFGKQFHKVTISGRASPALATHARTRLIPSLHDRGDAVAASRQPCGRAFQARTAIQNPRPQARKAGLATLAAPPATAKRVAVEEDVHEKAGDGFTCVHVLFRLPGLPAPSQPPSPQKERRQEVAAPTPAAHLPNLPCATFSAAASSLHENSTPAFRSFMNRKPFYLRFCRKRGLLSHRMSR